MTVPAVAAAPTQRARYDDGQGDELGPIATFGAQFFVFVALIFSFQVTGFTYFPGLTPLALLVGVFGVVLLAPLRVLMRLPVSLTVLSMIALMLLSTVWSQNPAGTAFALQRDVPIVLGFAIVIGLISLRDLVPALLWSARFTAWFTLATVLAFPEARIHIDPAGIEPDLPGWHGFFPHKNIMTPCLVYGVVTILTFDRTRILKWSTLAVTGVLLLGSDSVTGLAAAMFAVSVWVWLQLYRHLDIRNSSIFLISTVSMGLFAVLGAVASLASLTSASGRDMTFTGRTHIWAAAFDAFTERPLLGYGLGGLLYDNPPTPKAEEVWRAIGFVVPHAHNGPLDLLVQLGAVGLSIYMVLWVSTLAGGIAMVRDRPKVAAWIVAVMAVQAFIALSENVFLGSGWFPVLVMFRVLLMRTHAMELWTGDQLADRVRGRLRRRPATLRAA